MFACYFDESGDLESEHSIFCISGYFLSRQAAEQMDREWRLVLAQYDIPFFHMVDCAHGNEFFSAISKENRISLVIRLIELIKRYTIQGFTIIAEARHVDVDKDVSELYTEFADYATDAYQHMRKMQHMEGPIEFFFEAGHKGQPAAYSQIAHKISRDGDSVAFLRKQDAPLLQAADLLAWQSLKWLKDKVAEQRAPRKDFLSLMGHPHNFYHIHKTDGHLRTEIGLWPQSRRSSVTEEWAPHDDGPIPYFTRDGEDTPIIMINDVVRWGVGGLQIGLLEFEHVKAGRLCFAFDETILMKTTFAMLEICNSYVPDGKVMALTPEKFIVDSAQGDKVLFVKTTHGLSMAFTLTDEAIEDLKNQLNALESDPKAGE